MVAIRERMEPKQSRRDELFGEHRWASRFEPGVDTPIPTPVPNAALEPRRRSKQSTPASGSRSACQTRTGALRMATNRVLDELAQIAFADIGHVFDEHGAVIPFADLPPGIRSAIAEYSVYHGRNGTYSVTVRLHSKLPALAALGRYLGMFGNCAGHAPRARLRTANNTKGEENDRVPIAEFPTHFATVFGLRA